MQMGVRKGHCRNCIVNVPPHPPPKPAVSTVAFLTPLRTVSSV